MSLNHGSLFSGIGGFDLASDWMGWNNVFSCEINPYANRVLKYYWPNAIHYNDITKTDFTIHRGQIDILTGGFPCQPFSISGKRKGTEDNRDLWLEMYRAIREIQPTYVVAENVIGITNWNEGMVFDKVQTDLENEGYEVTPFLLPAVSQDAPHKRERVFFIAYSNRFRYGRRTEKKRSDQSEERIICEDIGQDKDGVWSQAERCVPTTANTEIIGLQGRVQANRKEGERPNDELINGCRRERNYGWESWPTVSPVCNGDDGLSFRLVGITFRKWRREGIKGGGNAVVPQVVHQIFKAIQQVHDSTQSN